MQTATLFTVSPSSQIGFVYGTEFKFTTNTSEEFDQIVWDLGDNSSLSYDNKTVVHSYDYPGIYTISLSAWDRNGILLTDKASVNVDYALRDLIQFKNIPKIFAIPGIKTLEPFVVSLTSSRIKEPLSLVLQANNSKSIPYYTVDEKWRFIVPTWKFVNADTEEPINYELKLKTNPIYLDSKIVAVSAEASFYYIDSLSTGTDPSIDCPLLLVATLCSENFVFPPESLNYPYYSYSNTEATKVVIPWQINDIIPTSLKVTENFISDIYPFKWTNVPIPILITCKFNPTSIPEYQNSPFKEETDVLSYPRTNFLGRLSPVVINLSGTQPVPFDFYNVEKEVVFFEATDEQGIPTGGYIFTSVTPLSPCDFDVVVQAQTLTNNFISTSAFFNFPDGYPINSSVWISHPYENTINRLDIVVNLAKCIDIKQYKEQKILTEGAINTIDIPLPSNQSLDNYSLSGAGGVYGMAFNPVLNNLYCADSENDTLYLFDQGKFLVKSVVLSSVTDNDYNTPSYISIDGSDNIWVSMYNSQTLLKFDKNLNFLLEALPENTIPLNTTEQNIDESGNEIGGIGSSLIAPPVVETDKTNSVWACYAHPLSSMLVKFDQFGDQIIYASALSVSSVPVSLAIDANNDVWVACYNQNVIQKYSTNGELLSTISGILKPSYLALDRENNLWFTNGYNFCGVLNTTTNNIQNWKFDTAFQTITNNSTYSEIDIADSLNENEIWGGLAVDVFNRVWAIDSEFNKTYVFLISEPLEARAVDLLPKATTNFILQGEESYITNIPATFVRSAQAAGDWTGNKWYQKYATRFSSVIVGGVSTPFKVYDAKSAFKLAKVNDNFDLSQYLKSLALPESLRTNKDLFDKFLKAVVGDGDSSKESIGRVVYEKIANFITSHSDIETCDIDQLLSYAKATLTDTKDLDLELPSDIQKLVTLFSIPKHLLRGQQTFEEQIGKDTGELLTNNTLISANQFLLFKDKFFEKYQTVYVAPKEINNIVTTVYPFEEIEIDGLRQPIVENYLAWEITNTPAGYKNNLIDWESDFTTLSYNLSTNEEWYGENGLVEASFNSILSQKLFVDLIPDAEKPFVPKVSFITQINGFNITNFDTSVMLTIVQPQDIE